MKILFLTQYYPPEIGAPQNRLHELAIRLQKVGIEVEVLTAMPNYPKMEIFEAYKKGKIKEEFIDGIKVYRCKIYVSNSKSIISRLLNYFSFVFTSYLKGKKLKKNYYDFILTESPPLFLAYSGIRLSKKLNAKLIFNVSDLWPESAEKLNIVSNKFLLKLAYNLEKKVYNYSYLITGQTNGIVKNIQKRFPNKKVYWLPNGVDLTYYNPVKEYKGDFRIRNNFKDDDILLFYGGILGYAQGLEIIIKAAKQINNSKIKFIIQGSGPEKDNLILLNNKYNNKNVFFLDPAPKSEMPHILNEIDIALIPLKKLDLFLGAIPSKIFESCAMEKPLLLGVDGEAKEHFIENANSGVFYEPENIDSFMNAITLLINNKEQLKEFGKNGRKYVSEFFDRNKIATDFKNFLQNNY